MTRPDWTRPKNENSFFGKSLSVSGRDCVFCRMVTGDIAVATIYEDDVVLAFLDIAPVSYGHTLLIPKQHVSHLHECSAELLGSLCSRLGKIAKAVLVGMNADGYNVLSNTGAAAGQIVEHLHFHIIPRKSGDGLFSQWPAQKYTEGQIQEVAARVREHL